MSTIGIILEYTGEQYDVSGDRHTLLKQRYWGQDCAAYINRHNKIHTEDKIHLGAEVGGKITGVQKIVPEGDTTDTWGYFIDISMCDVDKAIRILQSEIPGYFIIGVIG